MDVIYKAINKINNKCYIGYAKDFKLRKKRHLRDAKNNNGYYFHRALNKYGEENFEWNILYEGIDAKEKEEFYIKKK